MKLHVSHLTRYDYGQKVHFSPHLLYLRPRETPLLRVNSFSFNIAPEAKLVWTRDSHDVFLAWAYFWAPAAAFNIRSESEVETFDTNPFDFILKNYAVKFPFNYEPLEKFNLAPYLAPPFAETQTLLRRWLDEHFIDRPAETTPFLSALNQLLHSTLHYVSRHETGIQSSRRTVELGSGSCRDYAVFFVELCRTLGLAARFVSGYHYDPEPESPANNSMHAWVEVYLPGAGWKGLDPTHGLWCDDSFVPVAHAAVAESVNPIQGSYYSPVLVPAKLTASVLVENRSP
ncbi:MAG TPA: transglutaminase family protein [Opitutaceae bacterium]|jgi:transglutaminase-like putative cysteine protease|nr:transglutaminase family protein [Opitutaceae bacterium]